MRFNVYGSVHRKYILIYVYIQHDATLHSLFISGNCSTCFGWYFHPSPGAHLQHLVFVTPLLLSAVSGVRNPQNTQTSSNSSTIATDSSNGVTNTRCCRYSCMHSWWWMEVPPETRRAVSRYKKNVQSYILLYIYRNTIRSSHYSPH
jgi:hypothetical protein